VSWTTFAKHLREHVMRHLQQGIARRTFRERFTDLAFQGRRTETYVGTMGTVPEQVSSTRSLPAPSTLSPSPAGRRFDDFRS